MSFGIKALKRGERDHKGHERQHISTVILGADLAAVLKLVELKRELSPEKLRLITPRLITRDYLIQTYQHAVSTLRDNELTLQLAEKFPQLRSTRVENESLFYKEGQWHRFAGRAKSMELAPGEDYFLAPRQDIDLKTLFTDTDWNELDHILNTYQNVRALETIEKKTPGDLVNRDEWWMLFHDLGEVTCQELWLSLPSRAVLKASRHGQTLPPEVAAYFAGVSRRSAIALNWECTKELYPESRTLFVPQSMTHEWGHFILDVRPWDPERQCYPLSALILLQEEEPTSEFMADKIKLAKRVLDRVFPDFERHVRQEHIHASEDYFEAPGTIQNVEAMLVSVQTLHVVGVYGAATLEAWHLARALLTL